MGTLSEDAVKLPSKTTHKTTRENSPVVAATTPERCVQEWRLASRGEFQSDEWNPAGGEKIEKVIAENIVFHDTENIETVDTSSLASGNYDQDADSVAGLSSFLSRPVRIATYTWDQTGSYSPAPINPWALYFNTAQIKNKLENYGKIKCKLHLKFLVNGSPFHYGALRACYFPMADVRSDYFAVNDLVPMSQVPGVWIEPSVMDSAEMVLPFLWQHNWLEITDYSQFVDMGRLQMIEYADLRSANGATSSVTVALYAWAEDVVVMGPTTVGAMQSGSWIGTFQSDEYEETDGTISGPATAVAKIAGKLSDAPYIGPFAKATEMSANMVAGVARLFGYSNPPVIDDVMPMQNKTFHAFANSETRMPIDKLSLDPKNEVTVSSEVAGVKEKDPLVFTELLSHDSFILATNWSTSNGIDTLLYSAVVNPHYSSLAGGFRTMPPMTYFSPNFRFWRGSIIYRFKFVKTKFHRGRVLISYDPNGDISANTDTETTTFSRVVDLEHEDEVEFVVPYKATAPYSEVVPFQNYPQTISSDAVPTPPYTYDSRYYNGMITMRVQNVLSAPTTSSTITVLTFVRAGEDFMFAAPQSLSTVYSTRDPAGNLQSEVFEYAGSVGEFQSAEVITRDDTELDVHVGMITTGETISSMRPILHRTHYSTVQFCGAGPSTTTGMYLTRNNYLRIPPGYGRDITGQAYNNANSAAPYQYFWCQNNPIDWTLECFVGYRGSTTLHVNPLKGGSNARVIDHLSVARWYNAVRDGTSGNFNGRTDTFALTGSPCSALQRSSNNNPLLSGGGTSVTNPDTQSALSVNLPQYLPLRFYAAFHTVRDYDYKRSTRFHDHYTVRARFAITTSNASAFDWPAIETFYSAGVDFNPVFYLCTPRVFVTTSVPSASDT